MSFHARIKLAMRSRGIASMEALEKAMGRSKGYVSRTLSDRRDPRLASATEFARALRVRLEWLASGEGPMDDETGATGLTYAMLDGWSGAAAELARAPRWRGLTYAIEAAGRRPVFVRPERIDAEFVHAACRFWLDNAAESDREAAEVEEALQAESAKSR